MDIKRTQMKETLRKYEELEVLLQRQKEALLKETAECQDAGPVWPDLSAEERSILHEVYPVLKELDDVTTETLELQHQIELVKIRKEHRQISQQIKQWACDTDVPDLELTKWTREMKMLNSQKGNHKPGDEILCYDITYKTTPKTSEELTFCTLHRGIALQVKIKCKPKDRTGDTNTDNYEVWSSIHMDSLAGCVTDCIEKQTSAECMLKDAVWNCIEAELM